MNVFEKRNAAGRVIEIETSFSLYPAQENGLKILFGGEVLKKMDEISGILASLYIGTKDLIAMHVAELVLFEKPITTGEVGKVIARVVRVTEKIVCVYIQVFGGSTQEPDAFTTRYEGFGLCVVTKKNGRKNSRKMLRNLEPYSDETPLSDIALKVIEFLRSTRIELQMLRGKAARE